MRRLLHLFPALALALTFLACTAAEPPRTGHAHEGIPEASTAPDAFDPASSAPDADIPFDPSVRTGRLDNGLTYFVRVNQRPEERAELRLVVDAGSMQEDEDQLGLAHFVEHMAFNGTENYEKQELVDYLESIGMQFGPDLNAYTSFDETVYMLKVPTDDPELLSTGLEILGEWAGSIAFEDEEIDKERGVVLEEWRLGRGAEARMRDQQFPVLFHGSRYAERLPIGDPEIIETAPYDALRRFYRDWYRPDLMAVIAVGDFDPDEVEATIRRTFSDLTVPSEPRPRETPEVPDHDQTLVSIATDPEATLTAVSAYTKLPKSATGKLADVRRAVTESLYHSMVNSRLQEVSQRADPPFVFASSATGSFVRPLDVHYQFAVAREGNVEAGLEALLTESERVAQHGFSQGELDRAKSDLLRSYERAWEERDKRESASYASEYRAFFLENEPSPGIEVELALVRRFLPEIDLDQVNGLAGEWDLGKNRVILLNGPEKEREAYPDEEELLAVFESTDTSELEPWTDQVRDEPLVASAPVPGKVVEESTVPEIGVTEWTLENGVRMILKPTDFKNDQILLGSFSPGGSSLASDEDSTSATFATSILGEGGLGEFNQIELEKALSGKVVRVSAFIDELTEGVSGSASPTDLETLLQLVYLTVTSPRVDPEAYSSFMTRIGALVQNRLSRPESVFEDRLVETLSRSHHRRRPISEELLSEVDLDRAAAIYRERFADAGDFTFFLVGNFDPESIRPLVETWLGGLPAAGRVEHWTDLGVRPPEEPVEFEVRRGLEPKSQVRLYFNGAAEWTREQQYLAGALARALRIRLREVLREDLGGTYGVSVRSSLSRRPWESYRTSIGFGCDPQQVDELLAALEQELERARREGFPAEVIEKVQASQTRQRETQLRENGFWLGALDLYYDYELDPRLILDYDRLVESLDNAALIRAAQSFLDPGRSVLGVLYPEAPTDED